MAPLSLGWGVLIRPGLVRPPVSPTPRPHISGGGGGDREAQTDPRCYGMFNDHGDRRSGAQKRALQPLKGMIPARSHAQPIKAHPREKPR